jgi:ABC-type Zn uptake system ZnuABC Zn-binding protein ZnuA
MRNITRITALFASLLLASGALAQDAKPVVLATTTIVADVARNIAGDRLDVQSLLPADADTHAYEPTIDDALRAQQAAMIAAVGAGYEGFLSHLLENTSADVPVITLNTGLEIRALGSREPLGVLGEDGFDCASHDDHHDEESHDEEAHSDEAVHEDEHAHDACDPHTWMDPNYVIAWADALAQAFAQLDPAGAADYRANADAYIAQLEALDAEIAELTASLPEDARVLITNHEFMGYFADRYGFAVAATVMPGGTTDAEPDPQSLAELIALVREAGVPAIFAEVSANPQLAQMIADEAGARVVSTLYSESLSDANGPAPTFLAMMQANAQTIVDALAPPAG